MSSVLILAYLSGGGEAPCYTVRLRQCTLLQPSGETVEASFDFSFFGGACQD